MHNPKIDFLKQKYALSTPNQKPFLFFSRTLVCSLAVLAVLGMVFSYHVATTTENATNIPTPFSLFAAIKSFLTPNDAVLNGEENDRVNILITGIGGEGHDGPQLTDTMVFASYRPSTKKLALMSLPRDMTVNIPGYGYQKINHVNAYAEADKPGSGTPVTAKFVGDLLNQPVQYYVRVDFSGYSEFIDSIGGVDVDVDQTFTDPDYPILGKELDTCGNSKASMNPSTDDLLNGTGPSIPLANYSCRFTSITFTKGMMHMDGKTALEYVRSRHGNNGEGTDFARSRRQQKILLAVKEKVFSLGTILNPLRLSSMLETLQKNITTNFSVAELIRLGTDLKDLKSDEVTNHVIDNSPNSPLYETYVNGAYVLLPKNNDWTPLKQIAQYIFTSEKSVADAVAAAKASTTTLPTETPSTQPTVTTPEQTSAPTLSARIEIQNGTFLPGLAFHASQALDEQQGLNVIKVGNAPVRDYAKTVVYDLTNGQKPSELQALQTFFKTNTSITAADPHTKPAATGSNIDFLVILGQNSQKF